MTELPKTFDPAAIEARWYAHWEAQGLFRPDRPGAEPWTIVNPPPNVTGSLHIGHALDNTLQDILVRHARLQGKDARWVVGTDHAGIATQMVVERNLAKDGVKRTDLGREAFVDKVWEWKAESGGQITGQLRRLGCSMDWANERFTMDEGFSKAVIKVFVDLHKQGQLYRDKRLVNWDPGLGTAISDLEVETREVQGGFWTLRYPLEDGSGHIEVATTRPETMLADMAVAVHPDDERYAALVGKRVRLPITGRLIPIVADTHADPELGSGAVKITPGHDFNDFEVGKRAGFKAADMLNMLDAKARIVQCGGVPDELVGLDRFDARKRIVVMLEEAGALVRVEDRVIQAPYGDRSGVVIEPWLTDQWYVDAATLAKGPIEAVRDGRTRIVPKTWEKTFFNWMENIQPWCVSRQLWWGHRIPAWYGPKRKPDDADTDIGWTIEEQSFVAGTEANLLEQLYAYYGEDKRFVLLDTEGDYLERDEALSSNPHLVEQKGENVVALYQDEDVLDTWFSSALWPFATLGWPEESPSRLREGLGEGVSAGDALDPTAPPPTPPASGRGDSLGGRYPNDVLISGFDILFFWNARMMMQGMHFLGEVPFRTLYLHGLVRAADGQKMSKSKGNTVDPLGLIDRYGADALRFFMAAMESQGRDIKMDEKRVEGYRNFATKLWNATRFAMSNGIGASVGLEPPAASHAVNRWIIAETVETVQALDLALAELRFDAAANTIYQFAWSRFCDWYLELIKPAMVGDERGVIDAETRAVAGWVLDQILVMLHPFMPFLTEELWHALGEREYDLIVAKWPMPDARALDPEARREIEQLIDFVRQTRSLRTDYNVPAGARVGFIEIAAGASISPFLTKNRQAIQRLGRVQRVGLESGWEDIHTGAYEVTEQEFTDKGAVQGQGVQFSSFGVTYALLLGEHIDLAAERARLTKAITAAEKERDALAGRLSNPSFVERAKPEAVEKARADHAEKAAEAERLAAALKRLG